MPDRSIILRIVRPIIVRKIREAPNDGEALKIFGNGEILLSEINRPLTPNSEIAKLLRALGIEEEKIEEMLAPFEGQSE